MYNKLFLKQGDYLHKYKDPMVLDKIRKSIRRVMFDIFSDFATVPDVGTYMIMLEEDILLYKYIHSTLDFEPNSSKNIEIPRGSEYNKIRYFYNRKDYFLSFKVSEENNLIVYVSWELGKPSEQIRNLENMEYYLFPGFTNGLFKGFESPEINYIINDIMLLPLDAISIDKKPENNQFSEFEYYEKYKLQKYINENAKYNLGIYDRLYKNVSSMYDMNYYTDTKFIVTKDEVEYLIDISKKWYSMREEMYLTIDVEKL